MKIIDAHEHFFDNFSLEDTKKYLLDSNKKYNIKGSLISFSFNERINHSPFNNDYKNALDFTLSFCKEHHNFKMLIWFLPRSFNDINYLDNFINKNKKYIKGLKFHPYLSELGIDSKECIPFIELARKYSLPILVHTALDEFSNISRLENAAITNKDINFIAAHLELESNNKYCLEVIKRNKNIYGDTAWVKMENLKYAKKLKIINKIIFGTDNPIDEDETLSNKIYLDYFQNSIKLSKRDYKKIMYKNALKIYKIKLKEFK